MDYHDHLRENYYVHFIAEQSLKDISWCSICVQANDSKHVYSRDYNGILIKPLEQLLQYV